MAGLEVSNKVPLVDRLDDYLEVSYSFKILPISVEKFKLLLPRIFSLCELVSVKCDFSL